MQGFLDLGDFDSCITATLTLFVFSTTPSSVSLFPIPLALSCMSLNVLSSLVCSVGGAGDKVSVGVGGGGVAGPGFGCTSPDICRSFRWVWSGCRRCGFVIMLQISSATSI